MCDESLRHGWQDVLSRAHDRPTHADTVTRRVCVPLVTAVLVAFVLASLQPPFACTASSGMQEPRASPARVIGWAVFAGGVVALLAASKLLQRT